ncbi:Glucosamine-phosphate N-acetyltransferase-like protein [Actinomortierella wolfii]|nr:Glucosamine-phosphate N-acetyltransferase-like protein [Actinomortierella wolfii]
MASTTIPVQPLGDQQPLPSVLSVEEEAFKEPLKLSDTLFGGCIEQQQQQSSNMNEDDNKTSPIEKGDASTTSTNTDVAPKNDDELREEKFDAKADDHDTHQVAEQNKKESSSALDLSPDSTSPFTSSSSTSTSSSSSSSSSTSSSISDTTPISKANNIDQSTLAPSDTLSPTISNNSSATAAHQPSGVPLAPLSHTSPAKEHSSRSTKRNSFFSSLSALFSSRKTKKEHSLSPLAADTTATTTKAASRQSSFGSSSPLTDNSNTSNNNSNSNNMAKMGSNIASTLFSPSLISPEVQSQLPEGYLMRPLEMTDYEKGFYDCLAGLTVVGNVSAETFRSCFENMRRAPGVYHTVVIEDLAQSRIVASGTLIVEQKFIRGGGKAGHIEDIVVHDSQRGKKFGIRLIDQLKYLANQLGCYKLLLTCSESNEAFYEKSAFTRKDLHMALYLSSTSTSSTSSSSAPSSSIPPAIPVAPVQTAVVEESSSSSSSSSSSPRSSTSPSNNSSSTDVATLPALSASSCKLDIALGVTTETQNDISIMSADSEVEHTPSLAVH